LTQITSPCCQHDPNWSPDGQKIVYAQNVGAFSREMRVIAADGSGSPTTVVSSAYAPFDGATWSPDGTRLAFSNGVVYAVSSQDGSGLTQVSRGGFDSRYPDWGTFQLPDVGYPHPRGATPMRLPLVPAFEQCTDPDATHGAPLSFPSCKPPVQASSTVTFGNDAEGVQARFTGFLAMKVLNDDPSTESDEADVRIESRLTDVRCHVASDQCPGGALSDYTGTLHGQIVNLRITDHEGYASTISDRFIFPFSIPCAATADPAIGSLCSVTTTADTLLPEVVTGGRRTIWQIGGFQVLDGTPDDQPLAATGVFAP
jgi:hypothetical protein